MPRKHPNPDHVVIVDLPGGGHIYGPDNGTAHALARGLVATIAGLPVTVAHVWPQTSLAYITTSDVEPEAVIDPAFDAGAWVTRL